MPDKLTMLPPPLEIMLGTTAFAQKKGPSRLVASTSRHGKHLVYHPADLLLSAYVG